MKYLKYFENEADYQAYIQSEDFILPNVSYAVDIDTVFYHVVKTETGDYKIYLLEKKNISGLSYNMVDLGLPSGLLWADRNVGASAPEDFGTHFAWGETNGYNCSTKYCTATKLCSFLQPLIDDETELTPDNIDMILTEMGIEGTDITTMGVGFCKDKCFNSYFSDYFDTADYATTFNKYNNNGGLTVLDASDDAATVYMGSEYRMPTQTELEELINNTTMTCIDLQGNEFSQVDTIVEYNCKGIKLTGSNGNSIFIPTAGYCSDSVLKDVYSRGYLWTSSLYYEEYNNVIQNAYAHIFGFFYDNRYFLDSEQRYLGLPVRGVKAK